MPVRGAEAQRKAPSYIRNRSWWKFLSPFYKQLSHESPIRAMRPEGLGTPRVTSSPLSRGGSRFRLPPPFFVRPSLTSRFLLGLWQQSKGHKMKPPLIRTTALVAATLALAACATPHAEGSATAQSAGSATQSPAAVPVSAVFSTSMTRPAWRYRRRARPIAGFATGITDRGTMLPPPPTMPNRHCGGIIWRGCGQNMIWPR